MSNQAAIIQFLQQHLPFRLLSAEDLQAMLPLVQEKPLESGQVLFQEKTPPGAFFFIVYKGAICLTQESTAGPVLIDLCDEGDVLGVRALLAGDQYQTTATAQESSTVLAVPVAPTRTLLEKYPKVALYFAANFAAGLPIRAERYLQQTQDAHQKFDQEWGGSTPWTEELRQPEPVRQVIQASPHITVTEAARLMSAHSIGSLLITDPEGRPVGILTDSDLRRRVVSQERDPSRTKVSEVMSHPVRTLKEGQSVTGLVNHMLLHKARHFCFTADGTPNTPLTGVLSDRDILLSHGSHPAALARDLLKTMDPQRLRQIRDRAEQQVLQYLQQQVPVPTIAEMITHINDLLIAKAIRLAETELAHEGIPSPNLPFCWLSLGSEGRGEQLLRTDQDNALLYQNPTSQEQKKLAEVYFLALGKKVTQTLADCGFEKCPGDIMASNPAWCQPLEGWKTAFTRWVRQPEPKALMHANIFFDFRPVFGATALADELHNFVVSIVQNELFMTHFAHSALLNPPPMSFFRNFVVEKQGQYADQFDVKARAMMPLADAARVLAYSLKTPPYLGTISRFRAIAQADPKIGPLCEDAALAYEMLIRFRALEALNSGTSGRYLHIESLPRLQRQTLRNIFQEIEKIQKMLRVRFRTDLLRA